MADVALETPVVDFPAPPTDLPAEGKIDAQWSNDPKANHQN